MVLALKGRSLVAEGGVAVCGFKGEEQNSGRRFVGPQEEMAKGITLDPAVCEPNTVVVVSSLWKLGVGLCRGGCKQDSPPRSAWRPCSSLPSSCAPENG